MIFQKVSHLFLCGSLKSGCGCNVFQVWVYNLHIYKLFVLNHLDNCLQMWYNVAWLHFEAQKKLICFMYDIWIKVIYGYCNLHMFRLGCLEKMYSSCSLHISMCLKVMYTSCNTHIYRGQKAMYTSLMCVIKHRYHHVPNHCLDKIIQETYHRRLIWR